MKKKITFFITALICVVFPVIVAFLLYYSYIIKPPNDIIKTRGIERAYIEEIAPYPGIKLVVEQSTNRYEKIKELLQAKFFARYLGRTIILFIILTCFFAISLTIMVTPEKDDIQKGYWRTFWGIVSMSRQ